MNGIAQELPPSPPLTNSELRETADNLLQGLADRDRLANLQEYVKKSQELTEREIQLSQKELELEKQRTSIAERERDAEKSRGDQLETALKVATKKPGFGCALRKIFTLGLGRC